MHNGALTRKERLTYSDDDEVALVVTVLAGDACFQEKARTISAAEPEDRQACAEREAKSYTPKRGPHRDLIVQLLLDAADEPWRRKEIPPDMFFANRYRRAVWTDAPLDELDPRRARVRWKMLEEGARALTCFGAFKCIECRRVFSESARYERGASRRRSRRTHCDACKGSSRPALLVRSTLCGRRSTRQQGSGAASEPAGVRPNP